MKDKRIILKVGVGIMSHLHARRILVLSDSEQNDQRPDQLNCADSLYYCQLTHGVVYQCSIIIIFIC